MTTRKHITHLPSQNNSTLDFKQTLYSEFYSLKGAHWWALATSPTSSSLSYPFLPAALSCLSISHTPTRLIRSAAPRTGGFFPTVTWSGLSFNSGLCSSITSSEKTLTTLPKTHKPLFYCLYVLPLPHDIHTTWRVIYSVYLLLTLPLSYCPFFSLSLSPPPPLLKPVSKRKGAFILLTAVFPAPRTAPGIF